MRRRSAPGRVLCYHSVGTRQWGVNDVPADLFRAQLETALRLGYRFVSAGAIADGECGEYDLALTFDDGLMSVCDNAAPILDELRIPWTVFVVSNWAETAGGGSRLFMGWRELRGLAAAGVGVGSHSVSHPDFGRLTRTEARRELLESRSVIRDRLGVDVDSFAIPYGRSINWSSDLSSLAASVGYGHVYAQAVDTRAAGTVARTFVTRFDSPRVFRAALEGAFDSWEEAL